MSNKLQIIQIKRISDENFEGRKRPIGTDSYQHRPSVTIGRLRPNNYQTLL